MKKKDYYKAKRMSDGKWIFGYLIRISNKAHIVTYAGQDGIVADRVQTKTVCQRTGFKDRAGKDIYDDDFYKRADHSGGVYRITCKDGVYVGHELGDSERFSAMTYKKDICGNGDTDSDWMEAYIEVVGNLWD
jgi:hypothetical protein